MKITYLVWGYPHDDAIIKAFREAGITVETVMLPQEAVVFSQEAAEAQQGREEIDVGLLFAMEEQIRTSAGDIVFSVNFFARVSDFCQEEKIPYCSWVLQLPDFDLYTAAVRNPCNYLGICDSYLAARLQQAGVSKAFFLPDAVEEGKDADRPSAEVGVCFIAEWPEDRLKTDGMTVYGRGYLEACLHSQRVLYGASLLEDGLILRVQQEMMKDNPVPSGILAEMQKLFLVDRYLAPRCSRMQQDIFLYRAAESIRADRVRVYSDGEFADCRAQKMPFVREEEKRREIYAANEFTLVLAPYTMHDGIPRQTLEVIAAGGFPIAGFVKDYASFFKKDETLAYFTDSYGFIRNIVRYGNDKDARERVREAAFRLVQEAHTYRHRIATMLEMWGKL